MSSQSRFGSTTVAPENQTHPSPFARDLPTAWIRDDRLARNAFDELVRKGADKNLLTAFLGIVYVAARLSKGRLEWLRDSGKTIRTLRTFPHRLRSMAAEIEKFNRTLGRFPAFWMSLLAPQNDMEPVTFFQELPHALRLYADYIERLSRFAPKSVRPVWGVHALIYKLLDYIREATGSPRYDKTAILLNHAFDGQRNFNPDQLRNVAQRWKKNLRSSR